MFTTDTKLKMAKYSYFVVPQFEQFQILQMINAFNGAYSI